MANWCSNTVIFEGTPETIEQIRWLFKSMAEKEQQEQKGQLPDWVNQHNGGYFFDLFFDNDNTEVFQYQTKWSPNLEIIQKIAEHYKVDFVQDYEEMGNLIYGQATYHNRILQDIYLEDEDFEQYKYDEETDNYYFEGEIYNSDTEILEILLERKKGNQLNPIRTLIL
ncbi:hypothetical protein [Chryseobacterium sp. EO14]|uniref:DUF1281 family ferredoxin-like fold protein n=1 Tax=Chryseobacterium sp. EO14 TaxID=2950551 RepID=UPI00210DA2C0|nr:hypothetical protein [Chryseobacterium sp. EO14]MCQ4139539.1 hypothetical protein [Chryseobacterium sp. EO14]